MSLGWKTEKLKQEIRKIVRKWEDNFQERAWDESKLVTLWVNSVFFFPGEARVRVSSPCNNLSCVTDRLAKWQRQEAAFYWSVWVDHASHCLPQTEKEGGRKTGGEKMKKWRDGARGRNEEMLRKGGIDRLTLIQQNSQVEGSRKTEMWVKCLIQLWEFALPRKYLQCSMGNRRRDYFRLCSCLLCQPASQGRVKVLQGCKYINMWGGRRRRRGGGVVVEGSHLPQGVEMTPLHQCVPPLVFFPLSV